jgi:Tetrahydromethanopterin S-methyltransferase, subunit A
MEKLKTLNKLIEEADKISEIEKCLSCRCFYDTLMELMELLKKEKRDKDVEERLSRVIEKAVVTHNCFGCDPCYPVSVSNALSELAGGALTCSCGPVCQPIPRRNIPRQIEETPSWPIEQGEYTIGNKTSPVTISTLGSDELPEVLAKMLGSEGFALVGKTHTENIGIEKIVKNAISNPRIRFIILCGNDTRGHMAGQSLLSFVQNGVDQGRRIIGSKGQRPILKNLNLSEIQHFREQVNVIDLIGIEELRRIALEIKRCIEKNPGIFDISLDVKKAPIIEAKRPDRLILDPSGFFIIYPKKEECRIYLEHYRADGILNEVIYGEDPVLIASTAIDRGLVSRLDHAAYLGKELAKAELSMKVGFGYVQDGV